MGKYCELKDKRVMVTGAASGIGLATAQRFAAEGAKVFVVDCNRDALAKAMEDNPSWFENEFVNVNTGETFRIVDLKGKVILVETMATWCSNCCAGWLQSNPESARFQRAGRSRISVLLPNSDSTRSTASRAVLLRTSSAGFSSTMSSEARQPLSAIISMHNCASR